MVGGGEGAVMGEYCGVYRYVLLSKEKDHPGAEVWWWGAMEYTDMHGVEVVTEKAAG